MSNLDFIDLSGQRFGRLQVLQRTGSKAWFGKNNGKKTRKRYTDAQWLVRCDCGSEKLIATRHLKSGNSRSCGCLQKEFMRNHFSLPPGESARRLVLKYYKRAARDRNLPWSISDSEFYELTQKDCFYCGVKPEKVNTTVTGSFIFNGIDRIDNNRGYENVNIVACCEMCNLAKREMPFDIFMQWLKRAGEYQAAKEILCQI